MFPLHSIELSFSTPAIFALACVLLSAALSIWSYRQTQPAVSSPRRWTLITLRTLSLAILLVTLLAPVVRFIFTSLHPSSIAVLVDRSASMSIADRSGERSSLVREILHSDLSRILPKGVRVLYYSFGTSFRGPMNQQDSLIPRPGTEDEVTDISAALRGISREEDRSTVRAALMITDGVYTAGENPIHATEGLGVPLFTVGVGDTAEQKDALISHVTANEMVYSGTSVPVDLTVKSSGFGGEQVDVTISEGTTVLARSKVTLPTGSAETPSHLFFPVAEPGTHRFIARVSNLPGELTPVNNRREFTVRVLKSKLRVLLLSAAPDPDVAIIRQTLSEDRNLTVRARTQKIDGSFYEGVLSSSELDSADCLITIGVPSQSTAASSVELVRATIERRDLPVLFIAGRNLDYRRLQAMIPTMPVSVDQSASQPGSSQPLEVEFVPDPAQKINPLIATGNDGSSAGWTRLPPVFKSRISSRLREGSILLGSPKVRTVVLPEPFMATRSIAGSKSLAILGYGLWRWRLMAQGNVETSGLLASFLSSAISWLSTREEDRTLRVAPERDRFSRGEAISFDGQVYDATAHPVENASVKVTVTGNDQRLQTDLRPVGNGRYQGNFEGLPSGSYSYTAEATTDSLVLGRDRGLFSVGGMDLEFLDTRMNADLLRQLALRTGGVFVPAADISRLRDSLKARTALAPSEELRSETLELRRWPYSLGILVLLLAAEWILRKRGGML